MKEWTVVLGSGKATDESRTVGKVDGGLVEGSQALFGAGGYLGPVCGTDFGVVAPNAFAGWFGERGLLQSVGGGWLGGGGSGGLEEGDGKGEEDFAKEGSTGFGGGSAAGRSWGTKSRFLL